jgi:Arc/MetJ-type ribon-helix-helix transcriptional regulator
VRLDLKPELERYIEEQVKAGRFASPAEVVEAGIARLMLDPDPDELDAQDVVKIRESLEQMRRGEVLDWRQHSAELRKKYLGE